MTEKVEINAKEYTITKNYGNGLCDTINKLQNMEVIRWFDAYIFKDNGVVKACYVTDVTNIWRI